MAFLTRLCFFVVFIFLMSLLAPGYLKAQSPLSSWLKNEPIDVKTLSSDVPADMLPKNCQPNTKFITRPNNTIKAFTEISYQTCATQTAFGLQSSSTGDIRLNESSIAGSVRNANGGSLTTSPIPQSKHIMYLSGGFYGSNRYIVRDFAKNSTVNIQSDGSIQHRLKSGVSGQAIKDSQGTALDLRGFRFSNNGNWGVSDVPFRGMVRVNIETGEAFIFSNGYDYSNGIQPNFVFAISSDGRYVLASEPTYGVLKLYDLENCQPTSDPSKKNCSYKDLVPQIKSAHPGYSGLQSAQFSTNYSIRVVLKTKDQTNQMKNSYQLWTAAGENESGIEYLALGDSFASGEGAYNYKPYTDVEEPFNKCHLSTVSYPYLLGGQLGFNSAESVACSGAKMKDIFAADMSEYSSHGRQSEGKESHEHSDHIFNNFLVGYRPQENFVSKNKPSIVTLSISGNDIGFGKILLSCLMPGTCYESEQEKLNLSYTINSKFDELTNTFSQVKDSSQTHAKIYVLGYPSLAAPDGDCALNVLLNNEEINFSNKIIDQLNDVVKKAALKVGVTYIDVTHTFAGKRLCEAPSSDLAVNGLTAGDDKTFSVPLKLVNRKLNFYLTGRESYHPNQTGHKMYANTILDATNGFKLANLPPNQSEPPPNLDNPKNLTPFKIRFEDDLTDDFVLIDHPISIKTTGLRPSVHASVLLDSKPLSVENIPINSSGELYTSLNLPAHTAPGIHTLHVTGQSITGEPIDTQQTIYVAVSQTDIDGDGITNDLESCLLIESSIDLDGDHIDDACDNDISKATSAKQPENENIDSLPAKYYYSVPKKLEKLGSPGSTETTSAYQELSQKISAEVLGLIDSPASTPPALRVVEQVFESEKERLPKYIWIILALSLFLLSGLTVYRQQRKL